MRLDPGNSEWVAERIPGCERGFGENKTIFVVDDEIVAGVVFHNWHPEAGVIEISSFANSPKWFQRDILTGLLSYPFNQLNCQMVVARISTNNLRARRLWKALGSTEYIIPRLRGRDENEAISTLTAETWSVSKFKR